MGNVENNRPAKTTNIHETPKLRRYLKRICLFFFEVLSLKQNQVQTSVKEEGCPNLCDESLMFLQNGASTFDSAVFFRSMFSQRRAGCRLLDKPANNKSTHINSFKYIYIYFFVDIQDKPYIYICICIFV